MFKIIFSFFILFGLSHAAGSIHYDINSCLVADIEATIEINGVKTSNIAAGATGECGANVARSAIRMPFQNGDTLQLDLQSKTGDVFLTQLRVDFKDNTDQIAVAEVNQRLSSSDKYYECDIPQTYVLQSSDRTKTATVVIQSIKLQAFNVSNGNYSEEFESCSTPSTTASPVTEGTTPAGTTPAGTTPEGTTPEGTTPEGTTPEGTTPASEGTTASEDTTPSEGTTAAPDTTPSDGTTAADDTTTAEGTTHASEGTTAEGTTHASEGTTEGTTHASAGTTEGTTHSTPLGSSTSAHVTPSTTYIPVTAPPAATETHINVTDKKGVVCILAEFKGTLKIPYTVKKEKRTYTYPIAGVRQTTGSCGEASQSVVAVLENGWRLALDFVKSPSGKASRRLLAADSYAMSNVSLTYNLRDVPAAPQGDVTVFNSTSRNKVEVGESFACRAQDEVAMDGVKFDTQELKVQAFRDKKTGDFSSSQSCAADEKGSNVVPIVVGVVLTVLVIAIVVAYLIGRRRRRQGEGYQSLSP